MNRYTILYAYAWYALLWGPSRYEARITRLGVRLGAAARLEAEPSDVKQAYGAIVRREHRLIVGFTRLQRRQPRLTGPWPGTRNIPGGDVRRYLASRGLLAAVESLVPTACNANAAE